MGERWENERRKNKPRTLERLGCCYPKVGKEFGRFGQHSGSFGSRGVASDSPLIAFLFVPKGVVRR